MLHLSNYAISATHCVKNLYCVITNGIIKDFNRVTCQIEANKNILTAAAFQHNIVNFCPVGMNDVFLRYSVLKNQGTKMISGSIRKL